MLASLRTSRAKQEAIRGKEKMEPCTQGLKKKGNEHGRQIQRVSKLHCFWALANLFLKYFWEFFSSYNSIRVYTDNSSCSFSSPIGLFVIFSLFLDPTFCSNHYHHTRCLHPLVLLLYLVQIILTLFVF